MGNTSSELLIENENLFRALISTPIAILFAALTMYALSSGVNVVMTAIFVISALYFALSTLSYLAHYTNERFEGKAEPVFKNQNLGKAATFIVLSALSLTAVVKSFSGSAHVFFNGMFIALAIYCVLNLLAYAAFYTNDYFEAEA